MASPGSALRLCAAHNGQWLAYASRDFDGAFYCAKARREMAEQLDPQPSSVCGRTQPGKQRVRCISSAHPGEYVVLEREGDRVVVRRLGSPGSIAITTTLGSLYPAAGEVRFTRGCGA
jgi:hypothetical protein